MPPTLLPFLLARLPLRTLMNITIIILLSYPEGPRTQIVGFQGSKIYSEYGFWELKPYCLGYSDPLGNYFQYIIIPILLLLLLLLLLITLLLYCYYHSYYSCYHYYDCYNGEAWREACLQLHPQPSFHLLRHLLKHAADLTSEARSGFPGSGFRV